MSVRRSLKLCGFEGCNKVGSWHYFDMGPSYGKTSKMLEELIGRFDRDAITSWRGYCRIFLCLNYKVHLTSHPTLAFLLDREVPKPPWW